MCVEVKGQNDRLTDRQRAWAHVLLAGGVDMHVFKVLACPRAHRLISRVHVNLFLNPGERRGGGLSWR